MYIAVYHYTVSYLELFVKFILLAYIEISSYYIQALMTGLLWTACMAHDAN